MNAVQELGLTQLITFPTRGENTLDLLFTNSPLSVTDVSPGDCFADHVSIEFGILGNSVISLDDTQHILDFKNANFDGINLFLTSVNWDIHY